MGCVKRAIRREEFFCWSMLVPKRLRLRHWGARQGVVVDYRDELFGVLAGFSDRTPYPTGREAMAGAIGKVCRGLLRLGLFGRFLFFLR
jgi:hypothetical protein